MLICVAWIELAIHFSPQIEVGSIPHDCLSRSTKPLQEISHQFFSSKFPVAHDPLPLSPQNEEEHARLRRSLQRSRGNWDSSHPRYQLLTALHGFTQYRNGTQSELHRWRGLYKKASRHQRLVGIQMLSIWLARASCSLNQLLDSAINYTDKLKRTENLLKVNARLAQSIAQTGLQFYNITSSELDEFIRETEAQGRRADRTSVSQSMKHFVRDWADEGYTERQESFQCILRSLSQIPRTDDRPLRVLVPGAGLGRLAHEIHKLGGTCPV